MKKVIFSWSGGKDSAMALYELLRKGECEIVALLTVVTQDYGRISMHGVRKELLELQAASLGLPLEILYITKNSDNKEYESRMRETLLRHKMGGVEAVVFGDIFLEDLKRYREERLREIGLEAVFPIWKRDTRELADRFIELGFRAVITCVDTKVLDGIFSGRSFDRQLLAELPSSVDPCGENGEFHSFVYDGPIFSKPIVFDKGETVLRDRRFSYFDILPCLVLTGMIFWGMLSQNAFAQAINSKDGPGQNYFSIKDDMRSYEIIYKEHGKEYEAYFHAIREKIVQRLKSVYRRHYRDGDIDLHFVLNSNGSLNRIDVDIDKSTNDKELIDMAILSLQQASPFERFPKELDVSQLPFTLTISFKENRN